MTECGKLAIENTDSIISLSHSSYTLNIANIFNGTRISEKLENLKNNLIPKLVYIFNCDERVTKTF